MKVVVDTPIWSLALRRKFDKLSAQDKRLVFAVRDLIHEDKALMPGVVRQELLSGIKNPSEFDRLKEYLRIFQITCMIMSWLLNLTTHAALKEYQEQQ